MSSLCRLVESSVMILLQTLKDNLKPSELVGLEKPNYPCLYPESKQAKNNKGNRWVGPDFTTTCCCRGQSSPSAFHWQLTDSRPIVGWLLTDCWPTDGSTVDRLSVWGGWSVHDPSTFLRNNTRPCCSKPAYTSIELFYSRFLCQPTAWL